MRWQLISVVLVMFAAPVLAQTTTEAKPTINVQLFHPAAGGNDFVTVQSAEVNPHLKLNVGLNANYARNPLSIQVLKSDNSTDELGIVIKNRIDANLIASLGLFDIADIGLVMPFVSQGGFEEKKISAENVNLGKAPKSFTQGDLRILPRARVLRLEDGLLSVAVVAAVVVPTAQKAPYSSERNVVITPGIAVSTIAGSFRAALNVGYSVRDKTKLQTLVIDDELNAKIALGYNLNNNPAMPIELVAEAFAVSPAKDPLILTKKGQKRELFKASTSAEADVSLNIALTSHITVNFGAGAGIFPGYGAPLPRIFAGINYYTGNRRFRDADGDGVPDEADQCVEIPGPEANNGCPTDSDEDGVADEDDECPSEVGPQENRGCPVVDRDKDGVADKVDKCIDQPGPAENQGCPDIDTDVDGIPDRLDKCKFAAEDPDSFADEDGCPEIENDSDGIPDLNDICPNKPEDYDGFKDDDGCPDNDNDADGIPDWQDKCIDKAEDYNGIADEDGCPEKQKFVPLVTVTEEKIELKEKIFFKANSSVILSKSFMLLDQIVAVLKGHKNIAKVRIEGHTDSAGNNKRNLRLSRDRADSVRNYLIKKGVTPKRVVSEGFGEDKPIASNKTAKGREMNRRVEFVLVEHTPVGGDVTVVAPKAVIPVSKPAEPLPPAAAPSAEEEKPLFEIGPDTAEPDLMPMPESKPAVSKDKPGKDKAKTKSKHKAKGKTKSKGKGKKKPASKEPQIDFDF
ncbi:MAG: OmpA family protein [Deltaproteobacteria bacterium]|nr:OmpA family protein [Deltaproteobacteria bacterium]